MGKGWQSDYNDLLATIRNLRSPCLLLTVSNPIALQPLSEVDEAGAEEILNELYMLITKAFKQFPQLDKDED